MSGGVSIDIGGHTLAEGSIRHTGDDGILKDHGVVDAFLTVLRGIAQQLVRLDEVANLCTLLYSLKLVDAEAKVWLADSSKPAQRPDDCEISETRAGSANCLRCA